jgi:hypothetical protein
MFWNPTVTQISMLIFRWTAKDTNQSSKFSPPNFDGPLSNGVTLEVMAYRLYNSFKHESDMQVPPLRFQAKSTSKGTLPEYDEWFELFAELLALTQLSKPASFSLSIHTYIHDAVQSIGRPRMSGARTDKDIKKNS